MSSIREIEKEYDLEMLKLLELRLKKIRLKIEKNK